MKRAIVLSGGGAQGAYQIGVWKALRKLNINYDIVTGTSVGALNGALMAQNTYYKALHIWKNINYTDVFNTNLNNVYQDKNNIKKYLDIILKGGIETTALENVISNAIEPSKLLASDIEYGMAVTKWPSLKPLYLSKIDLDDQLLHDYLMASSAIYPLFKKKKIDKQTLIDGGFYDNLPINLAIDLGATEVIAVNLNAFGRIRKVKNKNIPITYISPRNNLGNFLAFEKDPVKRAIHLGYNDTLKTFNHYEGNLYTFRKDTLLKNYKYYYKPFDNLLNAIIKDNKPIKKIIKYKKLEDFNNIIEYLGEILNINDEKIYRADYFNHLIIYRINKVNYDSNITINELKKLVDQKQIITHFLYHLNQSLDINNLNHLNMLATFLPKAFLAAIYIKTLKEHNIIFKYSEVLTWNNLNGSSNK